MIGAIAGHRGAQALDRVGPHLHVRVHQEDVGLRRLADADVPSGIRAVVSVERVYADVGICRAKPVDGAVRARDIHHPNRRMRAGRGVERCERRWKLFAIVVGNDDDADVGRKGRHVHIRRPRPGRRKM